uniref:dTDP-4-amino-4,6-dideoxygalactose transaminase n=1 Tax=Candidatus Kentrum sp. MB TaxID=2138164 RepID=A0A450XHW9_9GAMM|nr:MAG: dTDP-4-amino-4,6-dideoxygalactose transaminase [Candidatus Kentron sp. MB]VFK28907.1 MAG: dTDP-4-amino-4,6-dideoxygalactose transaminase [Candidatus Kentron sp. MB]VFK74150.1 MAG: dTDP-4-amino-4,6-dideoxygalactose transaminase [Candidatus Kentron sp. MB]
MITLTIPDVREQDIGLAVDVLRSGQLVQGEYVCRLEEALATYIGARHVVAVSSGTAALHLALEALGIGAGDAVVVPAFSFVATANAVRLAGAEPVFADVSPTDYNLDVDLLERTIRGYGGAGRLKAIMPVHEFGCPADMTGISEIAKRYDLAVVEDAACGLGARHAGRHVGVFGACGCFSFHPRKSITTGEGGAIATEDGALAERLRLLRSHGVVRDEEGRIDCVAVGYNYRMTDFQAALFLHQLERFPGNLSARRVLVEAYYDGLAKHDRLGFPERTEGHAWQSLMLLRKEGDLPALIRAARESGIQLGQGAQCIPTTSAYGLAEGFPVADRCEHQGFVVPLYAGLSPEDAKRVMAWLREWL